MEEKGDLFSESVCDSDHYRSIRTALGLNFCVSRRKVAPDRISFFSEIGTTDLSIGAAVIPFS